jgi:hypothetical protein
VASVPAVHGGFLDKVPCGAIIEQERSFVVSHVLPLQEAPQGYRMFRDKQDGCIKVVLRTGASGKAALRAGRRWDHALNGRGAAGARSC